MRSRGSALLLAFSAAVLSLASCRPQVTSSRPTIPYVQDILADKFSEEMMILRSYDKPRTSGDIVIIGKDSVCMHFADFFRSVEEKDNVSGAAYHDLLPDFAGETLTCLMDRFDYGSFIQKNNSESFREMVVRRAVAALDTVSHVSRYDLEGLGSKNLAKILILADPLMAEYGAFDVDTLFNTAGCKVPVIVPLDYMLGKVFDKAPDRDLSVGIVCGRHFGDESTYRRSFSRIASSRGRSGSECFVYVNDGRDSLLHHFLDAYSSTGNARSLDALIVDDICLDLEQVKLELAGILSVLNESSMTYGRMISRDFNLVEAKDEVAELCYSMLRRNNLFTHNIAYPKVEEYEVHSRPQSEDGSIILIHSNYVQD